MINNMNSGIKKLKLFGMKYHIFSVFTFLFITGCNSNDNYSSHPNQNQYKLQAVLFHQRAAENRALAYQAYNIAKIQLDNDLKNQEITAPRAIITDIDETVLDNAPYEAFTVLKNASYPEKWEEWMKKAEAEAIPGALDFFNYAKSKGIEVFYITNRKEKYKPYTLENLKNLGFPFADEEHVFMRKQTKGKQQRREFVEMEYHVVMLLGDNLSDFSDFFDEANNDDRFLYTDSLKNEFGSRFIIFPNCMYGGWEGFIPQDEKNKDSCRKNALKKF